MIKNNKQISGDNSVNYMAEGDIIINNNYPTEISKKITFSRSSLRETIHQYFTENKFIFDNYGPMIEENLNPESVYPEIWKRKIIEKIIPNNANILKLLTENIHLLNENELKTFHQYKQHVDDFYAKHMDNCNVNGLQFPIDIIDILSDK